MDLLKIKHLRTIASIAIILSLAGCAHKLPKIYNVPSTSPSPGEQWRAPTKAIQKPFQKEDNIPLEQIGDKLTKLTLLDAVDIGLRNNPSTRAAWADARAAAASYGASRGNWFPTINASGNLNRSKGINTSTATNSDGSTTTYSAGVSLSYLLFDFGGRSAVVEESRQALIAANWTQNAVIQNEILRVQLAFYNYIGSGALLEANRTSLKEAELNFNAAEDKHKVGLATLADVLQAKTAYSEIKLAVQSAEGQVRIAKGSLAVAMGYPANLEYDINAIPPGNPEGEISKTVDKLITQALEMRPDIQASRALAMQMNARIKEMRSNLLPSVSAVGSLGRTWIDGISGYRNTYSGSLSLQVPLFSGFAREYDLMKAKAAADAALEDTKSLEQSITFQVFSTHSNFITAGERLTTANDLVASAVQSEEMALGRYKEGVGNILDLLSAQRTLANARAEQIYARLNWFQLLAQLAHDIGILRKNSDNPLLPMQQINQSLEVKK